MQSKDYEKVQFLVSEYSQRLIRPLWFFRNVDFLSFPKGLITQSDEKPHGKDYNRSEKKDRLVCEKSFTYFDITECYFAMFR